MFHLKNKMLKNFTTKKLLSFAVGIYIWGMDTYLMVDAFVYELKVHAVTLVIHSRGHQQLGTYWNNKNNNNK